MPEFFKIVRKAWIPVDKLKQLNLHHPTTLKILFFEYAKFAAPHRQKKVSARTTTALQWDPGYEQPERRQFPLLLQKLDE